MQLSIRKIILIYFYFFLLIDLVNGFFLNILGEIQSVSIGVAIRGMICFLLIYEIQYYRIINRYNQFIFYFVFIYPLIIIIYYLRGGDIEIIPIELISIIKPLFFLLLINHILNNFNFYKKKLNKIIFYNFTIFASAIILSYLFGVGVNAYSTYYEANKSYFYGSNSTAVIGFMLCIYYTYQTRNHLLNIYFLILSLLALLISGSMIIMLYPFFLIYFIIFKIKYSIYYKILTSTIISVLFFLIIIGTVNSINVTNNTLFNRYKERALHSINYFKDTNSINIIPLKWYSYISGTRALRANNGLNQIIKSPTAMIFGYGSAMRSEKVGELYAGRSGSEMDFIDIFLDYGFIGFIIIFIPIFRVLIPLCYKFDTRKNSMVIYFMFLYSCFAGHVITAPMGGTLFALFLGIEYGKQILLREVRPPQHSYLKHPIAI